MASRYTKQTKKPYRMSLIVRKMQTKHSTHPLVPVRAVTIKRSKDSKCWQSLKQKLCVGERKMNNQLISSWKIVWRSLKK